VLFHVWCLDIFARLYHDFWIEIKFVLVEFAAIRSPVLIVSL